MRRNEMLRAGVSWVVGGSPKQKTNILLFPSLWVHALLRHNRIQPEHLLFLVELLDTHRGRDLFVHENRSKELECLVEVDRLRARQVHAHDVGEERANEDAVADGAGEASFLGSDRVEVDGIAVTHEGGKLLHILLRKRPLDAVRVTDFDEPT